MHTVPYCVRAPIIINWDVYYRKERKSVELLSGKLLYYKSVLSSADVSQTIIVLQFIVNGSAPVFEGDLNDSTKSISVEMTKAKAEAEKSLILLK